MLGLIICAPLIAILYILARRAPGSALSQQVHIGKNGKRFALLRIQSRPTGLGTVATLWNVLRGDMSLVGPRPTPLEVAENPAHFAPAVRPGITGLHQVSRYRTRPPSKNPEYDAFYVPNRTFAFDLWLLWRTLALLAAHRETSLRMAARLWERDRSWRDAAPKQERAIPGPSPSWVRVRFALPIVLAGLSVMLTAAAWAGLSARRDLIAAQRSLTEAHRAATGVEVDGAESGLSRAADQFDSAGSKLRSWPILPLRAIPGINNNIEVPIAIADAGENLVAAGNAGIQLLEILPVDDADRSLFSNGDLDVNNLAAASEPAQRMRNNLRHTKSLISATPHRFLVPTVSRARARSLELLDEVLRQAEAAAAATELLPSMFGLGERRTWILGAENNAELRGRGGYLGSFGLLTAEDGRVHLGNFRGVSGLPGLPTDASTLGTDPEYVRQYLTIGGLSAWANLLMSPDFPTGARLFTTSLQRVANIPADGLISVDPMALSYLLEVTGPVEIPEIPEPITSGNVVDWTLNRLYFQYGDDTAERREQLSTIAGAVWAKIISDTDLDTGALIGALGKAADERHLILYSSRPQEQALFESLGLAGQVVASQDDYLLLVGQNFGQNKMDYYLSRDISYSGELDADGTLTAAATITVTNHAPTDVEFPHDVGGSRETLNLESGEALTLLNLFIPQRAQLQQMLRDGKEDPALQNATELGKRRLATYVKVGPGETEELTFSYRLPSAFRDGRYRLDVQKQSTVTPDTLAVRIQLPDGLSVTASDGFTDGAALGCTAVWSATGPGVCGTWRSSMPVELIAR
ncbi:MAG: DUF4012 domain-containing protein [Actinobacteria bacterium]|nr:DUF4012 domain-containing protein [Actinomycetota bacterium]